MRRRSTARVVITTVGLLIVAAGARAAEYPGWGDTGWVYASKWQCCQEAIAIAAQYSAQACTTSGGRPDPFAGDAQRGSCSSTWTQDADGNVLYRCSGEATVWCD